jgi:alpha-methylacyl-CoA racemase
MCEGAGLLAQMMWALRANGHWKNGRGRNPLDGSAPFYDTYTCAVGRHVAIGAIEAQFFAEALRILELDAAALPGQWDLVLQPHSEIGGAALVVEVAGAGLVAASPA